MDGILEFSGVESVQGQGSTGTMELALALRPDAPAEGC
jgi:hypothetical protein